MKAWQEIAVSMTLGLCLFTTLNRLLPVFKEKPRTLNQDRPAAVDVAVRDPENTWTWGLKEIGADRMWPVNDPSADTRHADIIVAVIDTGCDLFHPSLRPAIWTNPGEDGLDENGNSKSSNGVDDDANGWIDDLHGWSFTDDSPDVADEHGHGTHVAGIIASPLGIAPNAKLMILKYYSDETPSQDTLKNTIAAIRYAVRMGADVINYSGGGMFRSKAEEDILAWAASQGVLVVAAAGNEGLNADFFPFFPANYPLPNVLSVAATDRTHKLLSMSNFGPHSVHVAAPGRNIYSTLPHGQYGVMTGTSQATAFASGLAALMIDHDEQLRHQPKEVIQRMMASSSPASALQGRISSGGIIHAGQALRQKNIRAHKIETLTSDRRKQKKKALGEST